ncbi:MAG: nickel pincer cofactor biosynthesis protein LarC [Thermoguttaceae bacterium]
MSQIAYFDCLGGISGDMTLGALVDAGADLDAINAAIASLGLPGCRVRVEEVRKNGFRAVQATVDCEPESTHRNLHQILSLIDAGQLSPRAKEMARRVFTRLAEAEARVHGVDVDRVHFHEVGAADSIADLVGAAVGLDLLGIDRVEASSVPTGTGTITIAHGTCSIPAPATAELLRGIPLAASATEGELTTPTGAALLATLAQRFGPPPAMTIERIGCGAGRKDFLDRPNLLRLLVGPSTDAPTDDSQPVTVLETNLDDTTGELIGYCIAKIWDAGALDVFTTPIQMKKNRPGVMLTALCRPSDAAAIEDVLFRETTTLGIRRWTVARTVLRRQSHTVATPWGPVEGKIGWSRDGRPRWSPEFESCRRAAEQHRVPLREVVEAAIRAFDEKGLGIRD